MLLRLRNAFASMNETIRQQERVANNLANANTVGFKTERSFVEALNEQLDAEGNPVTTRSVNQWSDMSAGAMDKTGNPLDVAINGEGFFVVSDAAGGAQYTRAGRFTISSQGLLQDTAGRTVQGTDGPIQIPAGGGEIEILPTGEIKVGGTQIGKLQIVRFDDPGALTRIDGAAFGAGNQAPVAVEKPDVKQGFVETSNVDAMRDMTDMITYLRYFESQQKAIQSADALLGAVTKELGRF